MSYPGNYPIKDIREQFPALSRKHNGFDIAYFDGPGGSQVLGSVIDAMSEYMRGGTSNLAGQYPTSRKTEELIEVARVAMADFLGGKGKEIAFGQNMTSLTFSIAHSLSLDWDENSEIVVTEMDHRANVDPFVLVAKNKNAKIRWIRLDTDKMVLDTTDLEGIINMNTKLVAIGHASNGIGTINDVRKISKRAKEVGAIVVVDAVHSAPHIFIDRDELMADIILCSAYKFFGPHIGIASIRKDIFERLVPYKVNPAPKYIPGKLETGTQNFEAIASIPAIIDFMASLAEGDNRRERIRNTFVRFEEYENYLAEILRNTLRKIKEVKIYETKGEKTPTIAFSVQDKSPMEVADYLGQIGIFVGNGHFYAETISDLLDLTKEGGWIRVGMAPYNTLQEVERLIQGVKDIIAS